MNRVGVLVLSVLSLGTGCSLVANQRPGPVGPGTTRVDCATTKLPAVADAILAGSFVLGIGYSALRYDTGTWSGGQAIGAAGVSAGLTSLFLASANAGFTRANACLEAKEKLARRRPRPEPTRQATAAEPGGAGDDVKDDGRSAPPPIADPETPGGTSPPTPPPGTPPPAEYF